MKFIKNNAILFCDKGVFPTLLNVTSNGKIKNRTGLFATEKDNKGGENIISFGICSICGICVLSGIKLNWINTVSKVTVLGHKTLLDKKSKLICPKGGIISCLLSGQDS